MDNPYTNHDTGPEYTANVITAAEATEQALLVMDRVTGEMYNPQAKFDEMMNKPEILAVFKRLKVRQENKMLVYSLLGFNHYEGSDLVGVFESVEDAMECVNGDKWYYDEMGIVESELGIKVDVLGSVYYVSFMRFNGELHSTE